MEGLNLDAIHTLVGTHGEAMTWWQMALRAVLVFAVGLLIVRFAAARIFGKWGALDIILAVIVGSNLSRIITGNAPFAETLAATVLLVVLHAALARAVLRWPKLSNLIKGRAVCLIEDGRLNEAALRRQGIGEGDLRMALRARGVAELDQAETVYLERNGDISVIPRS